MSIDKDLARIAAIQLPDDAHGETSGRCYYAITVRGIGGVTIDTEKRVFRLGWTWHGKPASTERYAGRGWHERIVADAIGALRGRR